MKNSKKNKKNSANNILTDLPKIKINYCNLFFETFIHCNYIESEEHKTSLSEIHNKLNEYSLITIPSSTLYNFLTSKYKHDKKLNEFFLTNKPNPTEINKFEEKMQKIIPKKKKTIAKVQEEPIIIDYPPLF